MRVRSLPPRPRALLRLPGALAELLTQPLLHFGGGGHAAAAHLLLAIELRHRLPVELSAELPAELSAAELRAADPTR